MNEAMRKKIDSRKPKYLYKFYKPTIDNLNDIRNQRLFLSNPANFNDPFDGLIIKKGNALSKHIGAYIKTGDFSAMLKKTRRTISSQQSMARGGYQGLQRVLATLRAWAEHHKEECAMQYAQDMISKWEEIESGFSEYRFRVSSFITFPQRASFLKRTDMWAYYANDGKGFCVSYDRNAIKDPVLRYSISPVNYKEYVSELPAIPSRSDIINRLLEKSPVWKHEREWRIVQEMDEQATDPYKVEFPYACEVIAGYSSNKSLKDELCYISTSLSIPFRTLELEDNKRSFVSLVTNKDED